MAAIIFDCDGVLVNTEILAAEAYRAVYARHGLTIQPEAFQQMLGLKQADILNSLEGTEGGDCPLRRSLNSRRRYWNSSPSGPRLHWGSMKCCGR